MHPNGKARIPVKDVHTVYGHPEEISLRMYRNAGVNVRRGRNTLVTPRDVERASDARDARNAREVRGTRGGARDAEDSEEEGLWELLHEIDTGFGCVPGGGAYKDY
ncbi:uncharacterized protein B0H18DRAFT_149811 [Fomitopsis serialis]|uniref:uncharacterized protein n=1 Tax=Fomitopsis serialis TaxID=139415 RepID=UPI002008AE32|nr:uncharacterized protein B0H18DRAFT_149811 [Neoantrodia serialis]KAH9914104.1 hypothetical protein B0H18DRAFT_149811 [Neoantrodia serialis]